MKQKWQLWINGPLYWIQLHIWHRNPLLAAHQVSQKRALLVSFVLLLYIDYSLSLLSLDMKGGKFSEGFYQRRNKLYFISSSEQER